MRRHFAALMITLSAAFPAVAQQHDHSGSLPEFGLHIRMSALGSLPDTIEYQPFIRVQAACMDPDNRLSFKGYQHCRLHEQYTTAFANWNCKCFSGQCRPTDFRQVAKTAGNETGIEVKVDGVWRPVPLASLRKERATMTPELLEYEAHVCAGPQPYFFIECAWINMPA